MPDKPAPITGLSNDEHAAVVREGMRTAHNIRLQWKESFGRGEVTVLQLCEQSRANDSRRAISKIKLIELLSSTPGWSRRVAEQVLTRSGFSPTENIGGIRSKPARIELFSAIVASPPGRWRGRPKHPSSWPWGGKLSDLAEACGIRVEILTGEPEEESPVDETTSSATTEPVGISASIESEDLLEELFGASEEEEI